MKKTAQHTQGPWEFSKGEIWQIFANGKSIMGNEGYYPWVPSEEKDWQLIAASPDLLESLKKTNEDLVILRNSVFHAEQKDQKWQGVSELIDKWIDRNKVVIAKAQGENNE